MPKQRNHQHQRLPHRQHGQSRVRRYGLQLPTTISNFRWFGDPDAVRYPAGWIPRPVRPWYLILWLGLAGGIVILALLVFALLSLFGGH